VMIVSPDSCLLWQVVKRVLDLTSHKTHRVAFKSSEATQGAEIDPLALIDSAWVSGGVGENPTASRLCRFRIEIF
jgi:hypothetical protein